MTPLIWTSGAELGDTQKELEANLAIWLRSALLDYPFQQRDTFIKNEQHKWRAASALQKAIRRGHVETALRMANGLHGLDWEYVWRRMAVIALEDIGVADIPLVAAIVWVCGKPAWRNANGGCLNYLYLLVERMCLSVKDRSVCDLVCWVDWAPDLQTARANCFGPDPEHEDWRRAMMIDPDALLAHRMLAGWSIAGTKKCRGENVPEGLDGSFQKFMQIWSKQGPVELPLAVQMICQLGANKTGDSMPVAYPFIYEMAKKSFDNGPDVGSKTMGIGWEPDELVQLPIMGNYPSEAFDQHCREGKKAIRYWNKACAPIAEFLTDECKLAPDDVAGRFTVTSILVFRVEGAQVDKRLVFEGSKDLFDLAELALNQSQGCPGELNDYAMDLVRLNMPSLHHARKVVLDMIPPGAKPELPKQWWLGKLSKQPSPSLILPDLVSPTEAAEEAALLQSTATPAEYQQSIKAKAAQYVSEHLDAVALPKKKLVVIKKGKGS